MARLAEVVDPGLVANGPGLVATEMHARSSFLRVLRLLEKVERLLLGRSTETKSRSWNKGGGQKGEKRLGIVHRVRETVRPEEKVSPKREER